MIDLALKIEPKVLVLAWSGCLLLPVGIYCTGQWDEGGGRALIKFSPRKKWALYDCRRKGGPWGVGRGRNKLPVRGSYIHGQIFISPLKLGYEGVYVRVYVRRYMKRYLSLRGGIAAVYILYNNIFFAEIASPSELGTCVIFSFFNNKKLYFFIFSS